MLWGVEGLYFRFAFVMHRIQGLGFQLIQSFSIILFAARPASRCDLCRQRTICRHR